ncbi:alginate lyase family protein [Helicobacter suis]|uniref:alginate lyase family protein n=1 Tax=Helicobacter suis TaxID=104628 RepID=UPI0013D6A053|nr:alginate lyase family protein [Helicobacter suis]
MRKWILLSLCFLSTLQATHYFFRDFHAENLEYAIHLKRKMKKEIQACAQLNTLPHYTPTGERKADSCSAAFKRSATISYDLALGFLTSQKLEYAQKAKEILEKWAQTLQAVDSKEAQNLINFYMPYMNIAYSLIRSKFASPSFERFSSNMFTYARLNKDNNIGAWAILLGVSTALVTHNHDLLLRMADKWQKWILNAIDRKGVMAKEIVRTNTANYNSGPNKGIKGIAYTHFALEPISVAGQLLCENGFDLWHTRAAQRLFIAYNTTAGWVLDPRTFPYYQPNLIGINHDAYFLLLNQYFTSLAGQQAIKQDNFKGDKFRLEFNDDLKIRE